SDRTVARWSFGGEEWRGALGPAIARVQRGEAADDAEQRFVIAELVEQLQRFQQIVERLLGPALGAGDVAEIGEQISDAVGGLQLPEDRQALLKARRRLAE